MLNMDFTQSVILNTNEMEWQGSPADGVQRKPLAREEAERGHATSVVRYAKGASFDQHFHPKGEEILVLEGIFSDEHGDNGPGMYMRNPPGSHHTPFSEEGCVLFVKLHQFAEDDLAEVRVNTREADWQAGIGGLKVMSLHEHRGEHVALVKWPAGEKFQPHSHFGGEEIFVLSGVFKDEHGSYPANTWMRSPHLSEHHPFVEEETVIWVKTGHLPM